MSTNQHYVLGLAKVKDNDFISAIDLFSKAIDADPTEADFYAERGVCYLHLEKFDLSMFDMNKAVDLDPNYSYRYSCRAFVKARIGDVEGAVKDYEIAIKLDPDDAIAHNNLGLAHEQMGYYKKAKESFDKSNKIVGYDPEKRAKPVNNDEPVEQAKVKTDQNKQELPKSKKEDGRKIMTKVFTKKSTFKEFLGFIKNGFKLKENDKSGKS